MTDEEFDDYVPALERLVSAVAARDPQLVRKLLGEVPGDVYAVGLAAMLEVERGRARASDERQLWVALRKVTERAKRAEARVAELRGVLSDAAAKNARKKVA